MRVVTGSARGMKLHAPEGLDVRPTTDQVKESVFNIIQFEVEGARVLDLFAGSGQLGIEALSRGAQSATFIDQNRASVKAVKENLDHTRLSHLAAVRNEDAIAFLKMTDSEFDIAFLDPPYGNGILEKALPLLEEHMAGNGIIICETSREENLPDSFGRFKKIKEYRYGKIKLTVYRQAEVEEND